MPGYYPLNPREPVPMAQMYPQSRSYSLAKLNNMPRDYGIYEKVRVGGEQRRPYGMFDKLRRQQSYDDNMVHKMMFQQNQPRRLDGFDSLQMLNGHNDERILEKLMENSKGRTLTRDYDSSKNNSGKSTLLSTKSKNKKNKENNKENKRNNGLSISSVAMALIGSLANSKSEDNIYESVEQIHYRKTMENLNRKEKVRDIHRTGHPLFDHLREERAIASGSDNKRSNTGPSRKTSTTSSPLYSSNSSGDEQDNTLRRSNGRIYQTRNEVMRNERRHSHAVSPTWRRAGSAGSESDDEWAIPRPKIGGRRRDARVSSTDESDSSSKSSPMR